MVTPYLMIYIPMIKLNIAFIFPEREQMDEASEYKSKRNGAECKVSV